MANPEKKNRITHSCDNCSDDFDCEGDENGNAPGSGR